MQSPYTPPARGVPPCDTAAPALLAAHEGEQGRRLVELASMCLLELCGTAGCAGPVQRAPPAWRLLPVTGECTAQMGNSKPLISRCCGHPRRAARERQVSSSPAPGQASRAVPRSGAMRGSARLSRAAPAFPGQQAHRRAVPSQGDLLRAAVVPAHSSTVPLRQLALQTYRPESSAVLSVISPALQPGSQSGGGHGPPLRPATGTAARKTRPGPPSPPGPYLSRGGPGMWSYLAWTYVT